MKPNTSLSRGMCSLHCSRLALLSSLVCLVSRLMRTNKYCQVTPAWPAITRAISPSSSLYRVFVRGWSILNAVFVLLSDSLILILQYCPLCIFCIHCIREEIYSLSLSLPVKTVLNRAENFKYFYNYWVPSSSWDIYGFKYKDEIFVWF